MYLYILKLIESSQIKIGKVNFCLPVNIECLIFSTFSTQLTSFVINEQSNQKEIPGQKTEKYHSSTVHNNENTPKTTNKHRTHLECE